MEGADVVTFCQSDLLCTSFAAFDDMRRTGHLCDITITMQNQSFAAHRVILAAGIPYFRSVFTNNGSEIAETDAFLKGLDPKALESLIDFAYSSKISISMENARSLLLAAHYLKLNHVLDACVEFLSSRLRADNILELRALANRLGNTNLIESCKHYIRQNFEDMSKSFDFLRLPMSCIKEIISDDDLNVSCEEIVFETVINWVKISPSKRHAVLPEVLSEVRMIYLPIDYLITRVDSEDLVRTSVPCKDLVNQVKNYHLAKDKLLFPNIKTQPRSFRSVEVDVYSTCFNADRSECSVYSCDFVNETWRNISSKKVKNSGNFWNAVLVNEKIYMFSKETIETFHLKTLEWEKLEARHTAIDFACVFPYGNIIYCFGSEDAKFADKIRYLDALSKEWLKPGLMKTARWGSAASSLGGSIYVTGGCIRSNNLLSVVERYSPSTRKWAEAASMLNARRSHGCVTMNKKIYVCGGFTAAAERSSTAEVYDPLTNAWTFISSMEIKRSSVSLICHKKKIYALGGVTQSERKTLEVESYDPESDQWSTCFSVPKEFTVAVSNLSLKN